MRIIPVLDLKGRVAVHAVRGERHAYLPVRSVLASLADPVALARAFVTHLGADTCYVADLDAIAGLGNHGPTVRAIAGVGLTVWLDAGVATAGDAERALDHGAARVIVGTETLKEPSELTGIVAAIRRIAILPRRDCALSLDLRNGELLAGSPAVGRLDPAALTLVAWEADIRAFIVLDLGRVGTGGGADTRAARRLRQALPHAEIIVGGGVRDASDLRELAREGFDGALVATALHTGAITSALVPADG